MAGERIRALNQAGLETFSHFLSETRSVEAEGAAQLPPPWHLLRSNETTVELSLKAVVDQSKEFQSRFQLATYINAAFGEGFEDAFFRERRYWGLWAWLALFYFAQIRNSKKTQRVEHFIPDEWSPRTPGQRLGYRHAIRTGLRLLKENGEDFAKLLLLGRPVSEMGEMVETFASRPKILRSKNIRKTVLALYQNKDGTFKTGASTYPAKDGKSNAGRGGVRRFVDVYVPRLKLGYDVDAMNVKDIIHVCGPEISGSRFAKS